MPTNITSEIGSYAMQIFKDNYNWNKPIRSIGVRVADLMTDMVPVQLDLFNNQERRDRQHKMDLAVDEIRKALWILFDSAWNDVSESEIIFCKCEGRSHRTSTRVYGERK